jgi:hypothetical protein
MAERDLTTRRPRTVLQQIRDIALTIMATLVSIVCALIIYLVFAAGASLADLGNNSGDPAPGFSFEPEPEVIPTGSNGEPCIGEVPPPGC